jgi:hypothetical protein
LPVSPLIPVPSSRFGICENRRNLRFISPLLFAWFAYFAVEQEFSVPGSQLRPGAGQWFGPMAGRCLLRSVRIFRGGMLIFMEHTGVAKRLSMEVRPPAVDAGHDEAARSGLPARKDQSEIWKTGLRAIAACPSFRPFAFPRLRGDDISFGGRAFRIYILLSLLCCLSQKMKCHALSIPHYSSILSFHHSHRKVVRAKQSQEAVVGSLWSVVQTNPISGSRPGRPWYSWARCPCYGTPCGVTTNRASAPNKPNFGHSRAKGKCLVGKEL